MKVLSLFDGISCGMVALQRAEITVDEYIAYEIDKYAIQISQKNYPQIKHCGDVTVADFTKYRGFDLLLGGSPCTYWSIARNNRETTPDGVGGKLFLEYVRALKESKCKYFLYENNFSIHKNIKAFISEQLGVDPIMINSSLVSAQSRKRLFWTNIPNVTYPKDKGILLKDVIDCNTDTEPVILQRGHGYNKGGIKKGKCPTITATGSFVYNNFITSPIKIGQIGKGGQGQRIYSVYGKSVTLSANGGDKEQKQVYTESTYLTASMLSENLLRSKRNDYKPCLTITQAG